MVSQTLISFKCDSDQLALLDATCEKLGMKRNKFLNLLVAFGNKSAESFGKFMLLSAYQSALSELNQ